MKKINNFSVQFKIISEHQNHPKEYSNRNHSNHENQNPKSEKKLTKDRQEFINNIVASGFKQIHVK